MPTIVMQETRSQRPTTKLSTSIKSIVDSFKSCRSTIFADVRAIGCLQCANGNVRYKSAALNVNGLLNKVTGEMSSLTDTIETLDEVGKDVLNRNTMWMGENEKNVVETSKMI